MTRSFRTPALGLMATSALALGLAGCKIENRPLLARGDTPATPVYDGAPAPGPLDPTYAQGYGAPAAQPVGYLQPAEAYAYPQRAYAMSQPFYDEPPAYAFDYRDEQPWVWDSPDDGLMFAEPVDDGYRYYYYDPGEPYPYFVQDPDYSYAYGPDGALIALFAATGALIAADQWGPVEYRAHDYWRRGYDLDQSFQRSPRRGVDPGVWRQRAPAVTGGRSRWFEAAAAQPAWRQAQAGGWTQPGGARPLPGWSHEGGGGHRLAYAAAGAAAGAAAAGAAWAAHAPSHAHLAQAPQGWRPGERGWAPAAGVAHDQAGRGFQAFARSEPPRRMAHAPPPRWGGAGAPQMRFAERGAVPHAAPGQAHAAPEIWRQARQETPHAFAQVPPHGAGAPAWHAPAAPPFHSAGAPHFAQAPAPPHIPQGGGGGGMHFAQAAPAPHFGGGGGGGQPHFDPGAGGGGHPPQGGGGHGGGGGHDQHGHH